MRFYPLAEDGASGQALLAEYVAAKDLGKLRLGPERVYFRQGGRLCCLSYSAVSRCLRRQIVLPDALQKRGAPEALEALVFCGGDGLELAQVLIPGPTAMEIVIKELARRLPAGAMDGPL